MCQNSVKIILFLGSLLLCLFRLGFGRVLQMCVCVCACVSVHKGKGGVRGWDVFHMHTCKACVKWIEKLTEQEMLLRERECRRVVFFFSFFCLSWVWWLCVGGMSLRQVFVVFVSSSRLLILNSFQHPPPPPQNTKQGWLWHYFKMVPKFKQQLNWWFFPTIYHNITWGVFHTRK
jgi:hypothetical protein